MLQPRLLRPLRPFQRTTHLRPARRRGLSTNPPSSSAAKAQSRIDRILSRLPRRFQTYAQPLRSAPLPHLTAFLLLHELTAIAPLLAFFALFHSLNWLPAPLLDSKYFGRALDRWARYLARKGWLDYDDGASPSSADRDKGGSWGKQGSERVGVDGIEEGTRKPPKAAKVAVELAAAYVLTKALLPLRIAGSVWATPWFARTVLGPVGRWFSPLGRWVARNKTVAAVGLGGGVGLVGGVRFSRRERGERGDGQAGRAV